MKADTLRIVVPSCLTPDSELLAGISKRPERRNKAAHLLSYLHTGRYDERRSRPYIPVNAQRCQAIYTPKAYEGIRPYLLKHGIIETDNLYRKSTEQRRGFSKGYRISEQIKQDSTICEITDKALLSKLNQMRKATVKKYTPIIKGMERDLRAVSLPSDFDPDLFLASLPPTLTPHAVACLMNAIVKIQDARCPIHNTIQQGQWGRYFHKVNNTSKLIRPHLTIGGEPTCEVDVSNCQPLLMACLLRDARMIASCSAGFFYEDLMEACPVPYTREQMKTAVLTDVIAKVPKQGFEYWQGKPADLAFKNAFPTAYTLNEEYRAKHGDLALIRELQRLESDIIHNHVLPMAQQEGCPSVTIHDCILTDRKYAECVKACLELCFEQEAGIPCSIRV